MEFFKPTATIDFMKYRAPVRDPLARPRAAAASCSLFVPGPNYGIDFKGGTELELEFKGNVDPASVRQTVMELGYPAPRSSRSTDARRTASSSASRRSRRCPRRRSTAIQKQPAADARRRTRSTSMKVSPGGDKITLRLTRRRRAGGDPGGAGEGRRQACAASSPFGPQDDHRYEAQLVGVGDEVVRGLQQKLGERGARARRCASSGSAPRPASSSATRRSRRCSTRSLHHAVRRVPLRPALRAGRHHRAGPRRADRGAAVYVLLQKEFNLATVAAMLTIVGYSINDTIVIYDRIRENMQRMRDVALYQLINVSTTQTLSRTIITSSVTLLSIVGFFIWGTPISRTSRSRWSSASSSGSYSTIYIAAPLTEWMDRRFFRRLLAYAAIRAALVPDTRQALAPAIRRVEHRPRCSCAIREADPIAAQELARALAISPARPPRSCCTAGFGRARRARARSCRRGSRS